MDAGAFKHISKTFAIGKRKYFGMGVASKDALYLIITNERHDLAAALVAQGGLLLGMIAGAIIGATSGAPPIRSCTVADLEPGVRSHPDWPYSRSTDDEQKPVLVIPRESVKMIEHPSFSNLLDLDLGATPIAIEYRLFHGAEIRDYLVAAGWPVKWKGKVLSWGQGMSQRLDEKLNRADLSGN